MIHIEAATLIWTHSRRGLEEYAFKHHIPATRIYTTCHEPPNGPLVYFMVLRNKKAKEKRT